MEKINESNFEDTFWSLTGMTKTHEKYKVDKNLHYLETAPLEVLKKIFIQYRFFTKYYIADLTILIGKLPFGELKSILADILHEELGSGNADNAHPVLYDNFLNSIGISNAELNNADRECIQSLETIQRSLMNKSWAYGTGLRGMGGECLCQIYLETMHTYFSKNPCIIEIKDKIAWTFWDIHIGEVDLHHQKIVRDAINSLVASQPDVADDLINGYLESVNAWDNYWERIFEGAAYEHI